MSRKFVMLLLLVAGSLAMANGPVLTFERKAIDLGNIEVGTKAIALFHFKNTGNSPLVIKAVKPGCGCTTAELKKKNYAPGESGTIKIVFNSRDYNGKVTKGTKVYSNSVGHNVVNIQFEAMVISDLKPETTTIRFQDVVAGKTYHRKIAVENSMEKPLEINGCQLKGNPQIYENFPIKVNLTKGPDNRDYLDFSLAMGKDHRYIEQGSFTVSVHTNSIKLPNLYFQAIVQMRPPVRVQPMAVFMYQTRAGTTHANRIEFVSTSENPIKLKGITYEGSVLSFEKVQVTDQLVRVWINTEKKAPVGAFSAMVNVVIEENNKARTFSIPIRGSIQP